MSLACDSSPDLRYAMSENHNIHKDVLNLLADDDNPFVAHRARKTLERLKAVSNMPSVLNPKPFIMVQSMRRLASP